MIILTGADVVLPDRILSPGTVAIEGETIIEVISGARPVTSQVRTFIAGKQVYPLV